MEKLYCVLGLAVVLLIAWGFSNNRRQVDFNVVIRGLILQFAIGVLIISTTMGDLIFRFAQDTITPIIDLSDKGAEFMFGPSFREHFFAFKVLPTIIFASTLSYMLFYLGVLQKVISLLAKIMKRVMNISGAEALVSSANIFLGQTEAPLFVRPYIRSMTKTEILTMMVSGMATVAGGVMAAYVGLGISAGHLLSASLMSAPAAIVISRLLSPETEKSLTMGSIDVDVKAEDVNVFEAACHGASDGMKLALNVAAMLIAFISLMALFNLILAKIGNNMGFQMTLEEIFGWVFQPLAYLMGITWDESILVGRLLGTKVIVNEFLAYIQLSDYVKALNGSQQVLSSRAITLSTYALCGFANFSSVAIQIGGIGNLEPERKKDFAKLGMRALLGGTLACLMTAYIAGILI